jgi:hypothetical protein
MIICAAMQVTITNGSREDHIAIQRDDGSSATTTFPKKGPFPHDAMHYAVETALGMRHGFWGMIADGHHPEVIADMAKAAGHASAARADVPDAAIITLLQAERMVECFEADLWGGATAPCALLRDSIAVACAASHVPAPVLSDAAIARVRSHVAQMQADWAGGAIRFDWPG